MAYQVKFVQTTQSQYDAIATKESGTLYFTTDTKRIYKGSNLYAATAFDQLIADTIETNQITVDGKNVSLEGHKHTISDIEDYEDNTFWVTGSINVQTFEIQVDQSFSDAVEAADAGKHIRAKLDYTGNDDYVCPWVNTIYNNNGSAYMFDFHIMLDSTMLNPDTNWHPYLISVTWNSSGFEVRPYELSETDHEHSEYKVLQEAKTSPTASGTAISFIDTVSQDANGEITATKKSVRLATINQTGVVQLNNTLTSTSTSQAATANAVKTAYDLAESKSYVTIVDWEED